MTFKFNEDQQAAFDELNEWLGIDFMNEPFKILGGYAGTGKTTLMKSLVAANPQKRIVLCAPTNKAVKVLEDLDTHCDCMTIYSLLGLRMKQEEDTLVLSKEPTAKDKLREYNVVIIDEASMINAELLKYIEEAAKYNGIKFLFVGDPGQLNPVGEDKSLIWKKYSMIVLRKVERHDNQVLNFATHVRMLKAFDDLVMETDHSDTEGVWKYEYEQFIEEMLKYAANGEFQRKTKAIAWRNKTVDKMNKIIRTAIFGERAKHQLLKNDIIVFTGPYASVGNERMDIMTDDEAKVISFESKDEAIDGVEIKTYLVDVEINDYTYKIKIIADESQSKFDDVLDDIASSARNEKIYAKKKEKWEMFWQIKEQYANYKYGYAITAHRAQGSTYENVFVDVDDILCNQNTVEAKRCLYVASTRPSARLFLT